MIILVTITLLPFIVQNVYAKCIYEHDCYGIPGLSPLKEQIEQNVVSNIKCSNQEHVLVERPNGKLACVTNHTAHKTGWIIHHYSIADSQGNKAVVNQGLVHLIPFETTGLILKDLSFENNSLIATIKPNAEYGVLSLYIQHDLLVANPEQCYSINDPATSLFYLVIINGEGHKISESRNFNGEPVLNVHTTENARTIEIAGICF